MKTPVPKSDFNKVGGLQRHWDWAKTPVKVSCEYCEILHETFFNKYPEVMLLGWVKILFKNVFDISFCQ